MHSSKLNHPYPVLDNGGGRAGQRSSCVLWHSSASNAFTFSVSYIFNGLYSFASNNSWPNFIWTTLCYKLWLQLLHCFGFNTRNFITTNFQQSGTLWYHVSSLAQRLRSGIFCFHSSTVWFKAQSLSSKLLKWSCRNSPDTCMAIKPAK
jgi:hypothetical protein